MVSPKAAAAAVFALSFASFSNAQSNPLATFSMDNWNYEVKANIPSSGNDVFLQLSGPSSAGWVGTGIGTQMKDALMFVIYSNGNGNVTVSPRLGVGEVEPEYQSSIDFTLLEGSGIKNGIMTANIRCGSCRSWSTGSLDVTTTSQNFIWSIGNNEDVVTTDPAAGIHQHQAYGYYALNLKDATSTTASSNPFLSSDSSTNSSTDTSTGSVGASVGASVKPPRTKADKILIAHGVIMGVTFVLLFPFGAALIRSLNNRIPNAFALHRGVQILNLIFAFVGMGMGIWRSKIEGTQWSSYHQIMGVVIVCLLPLQGALGQMHHNMYLKIQRRSFWSYMHIWFGRTVIILGIVNGGIGLGPDMSDAPRGWVIAYVVIVALVATSYAAFYILGKRSRKNHYVPAHGNQYRNHYDGNQYPSEYHNQYGPEVHEEQWR